MKQVDPVNNPPHYKAPNGMEAIDVIEAFGLAQSFALGNAAKYLLRAGRKGDVVEDLRKARWYISRKIEHLQSGSSAEKPLYYLATPYKHYPGGMPAAFKDAAVIAGGLMRQGHHFFCAITHGHPIATNGGPPGGNHDIWIPFDEAFMARCDALLVAQMAGWEESQGIAYEIEFFRKAARPIFYLHPQTLAFSALPHERVAA